MPRIRVIEEVRHPKPGFGPLLPGIHLADSVRGGIAKIGDFELFPHQFVIVPEPPEPHPFSPEGWEKIAAGVYQPNREPGWTACRLCSIKAIG